MSGAISVAQIRTHSSKFASVRRILVLHLTVLIKLNMCSQRQRLPGNDHIMIQVNTVNLRTNVRGP